MGPDIFHFAAFVKSLYFDSPMTVGMLSNITGFLPVFVTGPEPRNVNEARSIEVLTADQTVGVRNFVTNLAGSQRLYVQGLIFMSLVKLFLILLHIDDITTTSGQVCCLLRLAIPPT